MVKARLFVIGTMSICGAAHAQSVPDSAATLGRDVGQQTARAADRPTIQTSIVNASPEASVGETGGGIFVGAVNVDGAQDVPRAAFMPVIEQFVGKQADAGALQTMAKAVANVARTRGYIFASAMVPQQDVSSGTVTVRLDAGAVTAIRITGSKSERLRRTLNLIVGPAVRKDVVERQLLLAGDIPGIEIVSTRYAREATGAVLIVEVHENRVSGSATLDNYGSSDLGPARLHLRFDLTGLLDGDDVLTAQAIVTPLQPKELGYAALRYAASIGTKGTQLGVAVAAGRTRPGDSFSAGRLTGESRYAAVFASRALVRSNHMSLWANAELAWLKVDQAWDGIAAQRDEIVTLTLSGTGSAKVAGGRLSGGLGVVQGLGLPGTNMANDTISSRYDGSARFTKAVFWLNYDRALSHGFNLRAAANGQIASVPLLAAQEIGVGGPGFGRGFDFSERFGDNGILGLIELQRKFENPIDGIDWVQLYGFADGGYVENLRGGFGDGALLSAGPGLRATFGKTEIGVEAAFPINTRRFDGDSKSPRINLTVGQNF